MCAKVPKLAELARRAVMHEDMAVVIGLQSKARASLSRLQAEEAADETTISRVRRRRCSSTSSRITLPTTSCQESAEEERLWDTIVADIVQVVNMWCSQETIIDTSGARAAAAPRRNDRNANDDRPMNDERENVAAPRRDAPNDDDFEMVQEKSLAQFMTSCGKIDRRFPRSDRRRYRKESGKRRERIASSTRAHGGSDRAG